MNKGCTNQSITLRLTLECEGSRGDVIDTMARSFDLFARGPRVDLESPEIGGAIGQTVPYDVLQNGLSFFARYDDFQPTELIELFIATPGALTLRERVVITAQQAQAGVVEHGFVDSEVAYLAGRHIEVYFTLPGRGPGWTSLRRSYTVESAP